MCCWIFATLGEGKVEVRVKLKMKVEVKVKIKVAVKIRVKFYVKVNRANNVLVQLYSPLLWCSAVIE